MGRVLAQWLRVDAAIETCPQLVRKFKMPVDEMGRILCPCCGEELRGLLDIVQWGMYDDRYITYLYCQECDKAFEYRYKQSSLALPE